MIVISAGMQKAGTGWHFNMINDLLAEASYQDVRRIRAKYHLQPILKYHNCNMGRLLLVKFALLMIPHFGGNTFVVKTHEGPTPTARVLSALNVVKSVYIFRDPRDAAVSAFEHGLKLREAGETLAFARLGTLEAAILAAKTWCKIWEQWADFPVTLIVRYEDLIHDPISEMEKLVAYLGLDVSTEALINIVTNYQPEQADNRKVDLLHLNKGVVGRYKEVMSSAQLDICRSELGPYLIKMGYQP